MPTVTTQEELKGFYFSAAELKALTDWPDALIEDYLTISENIINIVNKIDATIDDMQDVAPLAASVNRIKAQHNFLLKTRADISSLAASVNRIKAQHDRLSKSRLDTADLVASVNRINGLLGKAVSRLMNIEQTNHLSVRKMGIDRFPNMVSILPNGHLRIGAATGENFLEVEIDGTVRFVGNATVWKDINIGANNLGFPAAGSPDLVSWNATGIEVPAFDGGASTEYLNGAFEVQHDYKEGSDMQPHLHWAPTTADAGNVVWQLEFIVISGASVIDSGTLTVTSAATGTAWEEVKINFGDVIDGATMTIADQILFRLFRDPGDASDTYAHDAVVLTVGVHYEIDTLGSRQITTK